MGSVIMGSPARLNDARDFPAQGEEPQANSAQLELAVIAARTTAHFATTAVADRKLRLLIELCEL
jgi:hypothetical protein